MTSPDPADRTTELAGLRDCVTAEDYFAFLAVPYDQRVLDINRLHILRHFSAQVAAGLPPRRQAYRDALLRSYQAFVTGTAMDHRLFKVLRDRAPQAFVPAADVTVQAADVTVQVGGDAGRESRI